jgi:hypothetical protein
MASARARLRAVQQAQAAAPGAYVAAAVRLDRARAEVARCDDIVRCALGLLASTTSPDVAAALTGVSVAAARDARAAHRRDTAADPPAIAGT